MKTYITHCSAKKNASLQIGNLMVAPDNLYTATPTQRFMERCKASRVEWAILSDLYGVWFPRVHRKWYEKNPNTVTDAEFEKLLRGFDETLSKYGEIFFYHNPGRFHPLYRRLIRETQLRDKVALFSHLSEIC